jgi:hypothetical protein
MGSGLDDWIYWHFYYNYSSLQSQQLTINHCLNTWLDYECFLFCRDGFGSDLRIGHFFSFRCPLVNTPLLNCLLNSLTKEWLSAHLRMTNQWLSYDWTLESVRVSQSQSYFTTGGLPSISSSWGRTPWYSRPEFFFLNWTPVVIVLI